MTETDLTVLGNRAGDAERLKTDTDCGSGVSGLCAALLDCDSGAYRVSPLCVFKADRLCFFNNLIGVDALGVANFLALVDRVDTVFLESGENLRFSSFVTFKLSYYTLPPISPYGGQCTLQHH